MPRVAPLFLVDAVGDTVPAAQLDDMVAQLNATGVTNYEARSIPGDLHSFAYWSQVKNDALAFLAAGFASPPPTPTPTPSPTVSPSPTATPTPGATGNTLLNISTRASAGTGQNVLIGGFILGEGDGPKRVIVRAIGPSLAAAGVTAALADPSLQLVDSTGQVLATNDDWMSGTQAQEIIETTLAPERSQGIRYHRLARARRLYRDRERRGRDAEHRSCRGLRSGCRNAITVDEHLNPRPRGHG